MPCIERPQDFSQLPVDYGYDDSPVASKGYAFCNNTTAMLRTAKLAVTVFEMLALASARNIAVSEAFSKLALGANIIKTVGQPVLRTWKAANFLKNSRSKSNDSQTRQFFGYVGPWMFSLFSLFPLIKFLGKHGILPKGPYLDGFGALGLYGGGLVGCTVASLNGFYTGTCDLKDAEGYQTEADRLRAAGNNNEAKKFEGAARQYHLEGRDEIHGGIKYASEFAITALALALPRSSAQIWLIHSLKLAARAGGVAQSAWKVDARAKVKG